MALGEPKEWMDKIQPSGVSTRTGKEDGCVITTLAHEFGPYPDVVSEMELKHPEMMREFRRIQYEHYALFAAKQSAYGRGNIMLGGDIDDPLDVQAAVKGITIRLNDKMQRLINLVLKNITNVFKNESIDDTFTDMSIYCIIKEIVTRGKWR